MNSRSSTQPDSRSIAPPALAPAPFWRLVCLFAAKKIRSSVSRLLSPATCLLHAPALALALPLTLSAANRPVPGADLFADRAVRTFKIEITGAELEALKKE